MTASPTETLDPEVIAAQERFVKHLPRIHKVLRFRLRGLPEERKEEVMAEAVAITWQNYINRVREGRDPEPLVQKMAEFAARHAYRGGHLAGV